MHPKATPCKRFNANHNDGAILACKQYMHNFDFSSKKVGRPEMTGQGRQYGCPYWNGIDRNCTLIREGLFLPAKQHIRAYCLSRHHHACPHLQQSAGASVLNRQQTVSQFNRRRSIRILHSYPFRFSEISDTKTKICLHEDNAYTVDLSNHGIRFVAQVQLPLGTVLRYQLGPDENSHETHGTGQVVWVKPIDNTQLFYIGISFEHRE